MFLNLTHHVCVVFASSPGLRNIVMDPVFGHMLGYDSLDPFHHFGVAFGSLSAAQTAADNQWMERIREAKMVPYGPPPLIGYLLGSEYEVRNLRILLAGLEAGLPAATLRERMRESYV